MLFPKLYRTARRVVFKLVITKHNNLHMEALHEYGIQNLFIIYHNLQGTFT